MTFTVMIPNKVSLNKIYSGIHFRTRSKHKNDYHLAVVAAKVPRYNGPYPVSTHYHFRLNGSRLDISNHSYMQKMIEDGLVSAGIIAEDDQKHVAQIIMTGEYVPKGKGQNEVEITITPYENAILRIPTTDKRRQKLPNSTTT